MHASQLMFLCSVICFATGNIGWGIIFLILQIFC